MGTHRQGEPGRTRDVVGHGCLLDVLVDGLDVARGGHGVGPCGRGVDEGLEAAGELGHCWGEVVWDAEDGGAPEIM